MRVEVRAEWHPETDAVIVGLGAAGGIAAYVLTQAGLDVVALEAGPRIDASQMTLDEIRNNARNWMSEPKSRGERPTWRLDGSQVTEMLVVNGVGGTSIHYHAWSLRLPPWQFEARSRSQERYGPHSIPSDSTLADWPISYADLEPFYDRAEYAIGVSGKAGNLRGELQSGGNVFEGPRAREFPMPPVRPTGWTRMGPDPATSVVDRHGFSHEVPNLGVLGASNFPTTGGHNPTLTVQALSWLTSQHLVDEWAMRSRGGTAARNANRASA